MFCGDYIDHNYQNDWVYCHIFDLQQSHPSQVTVLMGNIDYIYLNDFQPFAFIHDVTKRKAMKQWIQALPNFYETNSQIFVHAGIDEEAGDFWKVGVPDEYFREKFPPVKGSFSKDIVAGHIGTESPYLANDADYHDVYWDGASHYYLDGSTETTGFIPVLEHDVDKKRYYHYPLIDDGCGIKKRIRMPVEKPFYN